MSLYLNGETIVTVHFGCWPIYERIPAVYTYGCHIMVSLKDPLSHHL